jgi:hypothetical protein
MRVLLDDRPIAVEPLTIARAIDVARESASAEGRIVIEVLGDGRSVDQALLDAPPADTAGFAELKLVTADPGAFVSVTLSDTHELLDAAAAAHQSAADLLMAGSREDAITPLREALESWAVVRDVVEKSASLIGVDPRTVATESGSGSAVIDGLTARLTDIKQALVQQDDAALSDVLAYDMPEQVEHWRALLRSLETAAAGGRN